MADLFYKLGRKVGKSLVKGKYLYNSALGSKKEALQAEYRLGSLLAREIELQNELIDSPWHQLFMESILKQLTTRVKNKDRIFFVKILHSNDLNAFALPGGFIFVTSALVNTLQNVKDEMAFVLAHEMIHIISRHPFKRMVTNYSMNALNQLFKGGTIVKTLGGDVLKNLISSHYSRANELQADEFGVRLMYSAGFDPAASINLLQRFKSYKKDDTFFNYFASHPPLDERINSLKQLIKL